MNIPNLSLSGPGDVLPRLICEVGEHVHLLPLAGVLSTRRVLLDFKILEITPCLDAGPVRQDEAGREDLHDPEERLAGREGVASREESSLHQ